MRMHRVYELVAVSIRFYNGNGQSLIISLERANVTVGFMIVVYGFRI